MNDNIYIVLAGCVLATYIWRGAGVLLSERIDPAGAVFEWVSCVAYAMLAGLMARVMFFPVGMLDQTSFFSRAAALSIGFIFFFIFKRNFFAGTVASTSTFFLLVKFVDGM